MGDTLSNMATEISRINANFKIWDKGQMIAILSGTKYDKGLDIHWVYLISFFVFLLY